MAITYHTKDTHALRQGPKMDTLAKFTSTNGSIKYNPPEKHLEALVILKNQPV